MKKIGVYGGSFNPPHSGHLLAAQETVAALGLDEMLFIPAAVPPHKKLTADSPDAAARLHLLEKATAELPFARVSDLELRREGKSYTADTLLALREQHPDDRLYLLMGTDMFLSLEHWSRTEIICRCAVIVTTYRSRDDLDERTEIEQQAEMLRARFDAQVVILENRFVEISSTMVRRLMVFNCPGPYLKDGVWAEIQKNGWYGVGENRKNLPFEELKEQSLALHKKKRIPHVIGCCETAQKLAERWGADEALAARAGILHDVTKALDGTEQLLLCEKYGIIKDIFEQKHEKLLHAKTGAAVAREIFGECDTVCDAIYWHTTGKADMTLMEKIIYLADYMEPNRSFDGIEPLREKAFSNLDEAVLLGLDMSIAELQREGKPIGVRSAEARDFLRRQLGQTV